MYKRLLIVFMLGFSSGLPLALVSSTLQAWFSASGMPILATGMLSLVGLPYILRVFWAPLLDRFSLLSLGKRRSWIVVMQGLLLLGFNAMAWLSPTTSPVFMAVLAFMLASFSATQDLAIDAHRIEYLPFPEHGLGASLATFGYRVALLVSGGLALIVAQAMGWSVAYRLMGLFMLFGMMAVWFSPEPAHPQVNQPRGLASFVEPFHELLSRPNMIFWLLFILLYKTGEAFTTTTSGIVMPFLIQGLGFSLDTIAYVNKIIGIGAILLGGLVAGLLLMRCSLYWALLIFGLLQALTNLLFVVLAVVGHHVPTFVVAVISDNFSAGLASTALVVLFMRLADRRYTATQFSILVAFSTLPRVLSGPMGAMLQSWLGWVGLYQMAFVFSLGFLPFLIMLRTPILALNSDKKA